MHFFFYFVILKKKRKKKKRGEFMEKKASMICSGNWKLEIENETHN